jgi:hypothetical protein
VCCRCCRQRSDYSTVLVRRRFGGLTLLDTTGRDNYSHEQRHSVVLLCTTEAAEPVPEVTHVLSLLGFESSEEHKVILRALGNGECIFRDLDGRAGRTGVDLVSETNPEKNCRTEGASRG